MKKLFEYLIEHGGSIISSNDLSPDWVNQARASGRMWVDDFGYGFIWEPPISGFPTNDKELELFEKWYPLPVELPKDLTYENLLKRIEERKQPTKTRYLKESDIPEFIKKRIKKVDK